MNNNNDLIILGILSITVLILLFRSNKKSKNIVKKQPHKKKVRINPIPISEHIMSPHEKYYETHLTEQEKPKPTVLVLLCYANWCDQCKRYKKIFKELIEQQPFQQVTFAMIEEQERGKYFKYTKDIYGYPTVIIDNNGQQTQYTGEREKISILRHVKNIIHT